jgi:hypothetical protein
VLGIGTARIGGTFISVIRGFRRSIAGVTTPTIVTSVPTAMPRSLAGLAASADAFYPYYAIAGDATDPADVYFARVGP